MDCGLNITPSIGSLPKFSQFSCYSHTNPRFKSKQLFRIYTNDAVSSLSSSSSSRATVRAVGDVHRRSNLESPFCYDKPIPEEIIEKPIGLSLIEINVGDNPRCPSCQAKGAVLCTTCSGSGLYIDSILESQGIIVKVRCLGCGGTGNTMCSECGGRGHIGVA
ncbi:uncharacterized protein LOC111368928 [Olea europaea subsp. europaea]|uniref:Uncharacterized protein LOC111368928 n=1 Tax=Olea europaea subsp. europaea TaxID=158383 RepID=A0A8S0VII4_OLEEU|nr:uncharacterized protein LOC111368928 [Olea europaea subsp. europaea]